MSHVLSHSYHQHIVIHRYYSYHLPPEFQPAHLFVCAVPVYCTVRGVMWTEA